MSHSELVESYRIRQQLDRLEAYMTRILAILEHERGYGPGLTLPKFLEKGSQPEYTTRKERRRKE